MQRPLVVTLDGPAGAGKSTVSRSLADRLGWRLLDTGAMFRAVTLAALNQGVSLEDLEAVETVAAVNRFDFDGSRVWLNDEDVTSRIRSSEITAQTRHVANHPGIRQQLRGWQRDFALTHGPIIAEGRDQGTIVFPDAILKIFLTASSEERAQRRYAEFLNRGESVEYQNVLSDLIRRDEEDKRRAIAPLKPADNALLFDTTGMEPSLVIDQLEHQVRQALQSMESLS